MSKTIEIPLYMIAIKEDGYHLFLEVKINNTKAYLLLDTGASRTIFDLETMKEIHAGIAMEANEDMATGLGSSTVENFVAIIEKLEIGSLVILDFEAGLLDLTHVNNSYALIDIPPIAGVFGSDILMAYDAVINYKKKTLKLRRSSR